MLIKDMNKKELRQAYQDLLGKHSIACHRLFMSFHTIMKAAHESQTPPTINGDMGLHIIDTCMILQSHVGNLRDEKWGNESMWNWLEENTKRIMDTAMKNEADKP